MPRSLPNIIITGTPGTGKTTTAQHLITISPLKHLSVTKIAKEQSLFDSYDEELQTHTLDEDRLLDYIEEVIRDGEEGGFVIDWHVCDVFPERWVDLVVVLRCEDTSVFYERLASTSNASNGIDESSTSKVTTITGSESISSEGGSNPGSAGVDGGEKRGYSGKKLEENIDAEIFGVIAEEAKEAWPGEGRVVELQSVTAEQIEENAERIWEWCQQWVKDREGEKEDD